VLGLTRRVLHANTPPHRPALPHFVMPACLQAVVQTLRDVQSAGMETLTQRFAFEVAMLAGVAFTGGDSPKAARLIAVTFVQGEWWALGACDGLY